MFILPGIGLFTAHFIHILEKRPKVHNYLARFNEANAARFYLNSRKIVNQLKNVCLLIFSLVMFESIIMALDWGNGWGPCSLPIIIIGTLIPIVLGFIRQPAIE